MPHSKRRTVDAEPERRALGDTFGGSARIGVSHAPSRRFPAPCTVTQLSQIGFTPVSEPNRPSSVRRMFDRKTGDSPKQDWAEVIRRHYEAAAQEPVPEEFKTLMDEIARKIEK